MLNLFQHLIKSMSYETLKQVQGDKKTEIVVFRLFTIPSRFSKQGIDKISCDGI